MHKIEMTEDHKYTVDGKQALGVTTVLKEEGFINCDWYTEQARIRGDLVHKATQFIDAGTLDQDSIDPILEPYLKAYESFLSSMTPYYIYTEYKVCDPLLRWAGTLDRAGFFGDRAFLLDIKSGLIQPWTRLQTSAYLDGLIRDDKRFEEADRYGLQLKVDGTFKLIKYDPKKFREELKTFRNAVSNCYWKKTNLKGE